MTEFKTVFLTLIAIPVWICVAVGIVIVIVMRRVSISRAKTYVTKGLKFDLVAAVFATLYFRYMVVSSGSVSTLLSNILGMGVPLLTLFVVVPLLVGAISAQPTLGIGIVFPILMPLVAPIDVNWMTIMFAGIVAGDTACPIHLCLILTNQYYKSDLNKVYKYLIPGLLFLIYAMVLYHFTLSSL